MSTTTDSTDPLLATIQYVDRLFGLGMGERHVRFLDRLQNPALREMILRYHAVEADTRWLSLEENYLIGMCVLCAGGQLDTAAMFAKTLLHLGVDKGKINEAIGRLAMWVGGLPAAEAAFAIQRAVKEYEREGLASLRVWFPEVSV
jgi:alkylhydroperoxidase/carboxymuconolactone decarboxylase family protein YurZ